VGEKDPNRHVGKTREVEAIPATCSTTGRTRAVYCADCGALISGNEVIPMTDEHDWGETTYTWSSDYSTVTATRVCKRNSEHIETETVATTSVIKKEATCETVGITVYTSGAFKNSAFAVQTKEVSNIPAFGHDWGSVKYTWANDYSSVTAKRVCLNDYSHIEEETVEPSLITTSLEDGRTKYDYTAAFTNPAFATQTKSVTLAVDPDGHIWNVITEYPYADNGSGEDPDSDSALIDTGRVTLYGGKKYKVCIDCGEEVLLEQLFIVPALADTELSQSLLGSDETYLSEYTDILNERLQASVTLPTKADGTGEYEAYITATFEWAEDYSNLTIGEIREYLETTGNNYVVKVRITPAYAVYEGDGTVFEGEFGTNYDANDIYGDLDDFKEAVVEVEIVNTVAIG